MILKDILTLINDNTDMISLYDPLTNLYLTFEQVKQDYDGAYDNCVVTGISLNLGSGYNPVLEIYILSQ